jgi:hypothetical protein
LKTTLNRPYGTYTSIAIYPGLASWAKVNRAYGAARQSDDPFRIQECHLRITGASRRYLARDDSLDVTRTVEGSGYFVPSFVTIVYSSFVTG